MAIISGAPIGVILDSYDKATADLGRARADMEAAIDAYGKAAARQVLALRLMGAPDHETARQWVKDWKRAGVLPKMQGPRTLEEARAGFNPPPADKAYRLAKSMMDFNGGYSTHILIGAQLYQMGQMQGKRLERARHRQNKGD